MLIDEISSIVHNFKNKISVMYSRGDIPFQREMKFITQLGLQVSMPFETEKRNREIKSCDMLHGGSG